MWMFWFERPIQPNNICLFKNDAFCGFYTDMATPTHVLCLRDNVKTPSMKTKTLGNLEDIVELWNDSPLYSGGLAFVRRSGSDVTSCRLRFLSHLKRSYAIPPLSTQRCRVREANQETKSGNSWMQLWTLDYPPRLSSFSVPPKALHMLICWNKGVGLSYISAHRLLHRASVCWG